MTLRTLGWREWIALPELGLPRIKAKIDSGARTSALHAFEVKRFSRHGQRWVRFKIHPRQRDRATVAVCEAPIKDERVVSDSGGHRERRIVIETVTVVGGRRFPIELTLTRRDTMLFRMLLGRTALSGHYLIDTNRSYVAGEPVVEAAGEER